jgi:hypothetical protein
MQLHYLVIKSVAKWQCHIAYLDGCKVHVSHIFIIMWLSLQLDVMYCLLQLEFYITCWKGLSLITSCMW